MWNNMVREGKHYGAVGKAIKRGRENIAQEGKGTVADLEKFHKRTIRQ